MDEAREEVELEEMSLTTEANPRDQDEDDEETSDDGDAATDSLLHNTMGLRANGTNRTRIDLPPSKRTWKIVLGLAVMVVVFLLLASFLASFWITLPNSKGKGDKLALTPPMGWNSWNKFDCQGLNEGLAKGIADALVRTGLAEAGYVYVNLDDCWQIDRDSIGTIQPDTAESRFKSGIKPLADYIHGKGLKFGLYTDMGTLTCQRRPGSYKHEDIDAETYASWGVDFIKNDDCYVYPTLDIVGDYQRMWDAIRRTSRPMIHSVKASLYVEHAHKLSHMRRIGEDIHPEWDSVLALVDRVIEEELWRFAQPGFWNDLDMLEVGNGVLTENENIAHLALWCAFKAPLILGNDVRSMSNFTLNLLTHDEFLSVLKDPLGKSAEMVHASRPASGSAQHQAVSKRCDTHDPSQIWHYNKDKKSLSNNQTGNCLAAGWRDYVYIEDCDPKVETQHWLIDFNLRRINHNKDTCLTTSTQTGSGAKVRNCSSDPKNQNKYWETFNDVFGIEITEEDAFIFKNAREKCLAVGGSPELQIFAGPLTDNRHVAVLLNRDNKPHNITLKWEYLQQYAIGLDTQAVYKVRDLYERKDKGEHKGSFTSSVDPHSVLMATFMP